MGASDGVFISPSHSFPYCAKITQQHVYQIISTYKFNHPKRCRKEHPNPFLTGLTGLLSCTKEPLQLGDRRGGHQRQGLPLAKALVQGVD
jgi:hypothetical protein